MISFRCASLVSPPPSPSLPLSLPTPRSARRPKLNDKMNYGRGQIIGPWTPLLDWVHGPFIHCMDPVKKRVYGPGIHVLSSAINYIYYVSYHGYERLFENKLKSTRKSCNVNCNQPYHCGNIYNIYIYFLSLPTQCTDCDKKKLQISWKLKRWFIILIQGSGKLKKCQKLSSKNIFTFSGNKRRTKRQGKNAVS